MVLNSRRVILGLILSVAWGWGYSETPQVVSPEIQALVPLAAQGDLVAQVTLGRWYSSLVSTQGHPDYAQAARWFGMAAEQGNARWQFELGLLYSSGKGVPLDAVKAAGLFREASEQGKDYAQVEFGKALLEGIGVEKSTLEAMNYFKKAASQGNKEAKSLLARMYASGFGEQQAEKFGHKTVNLARPCVPEQRPDLSSPLAKAHFDDATRALFLDQFKIVIIDWPYLSKYLKAYGNAFSWWTNCKESNETKSIQGEAGVLLAKFNPSTMDKDLEALKHVCNVCLMAQRDWHQAANGSAYSPLHNCSPEEFAQFENQKCDFDIAKVLNQMYSYISEAPALERIALRVSAQIGQVESNLQKSDIIESVKFYDELRNYYTANSNYGFRAADLGSNRFVSVKEIMSLLHLYLEARSPVLNDCRAFASLPLAKTQTLSGHIRDMAILLGELRGGNHGEAFASLSEFGLCLMTQSVHNALIQAKDYQFENARFVTFESTHPFKSNSVRDEIKELGTLVDILKREKDEKQDLHCEIAPSLVEELTARLGQDDMHSLLRLQEELGKVAQTLVHGQERLRLAEMHVQERIDCFNEFHSALSSAATLEIVLGLDPSAANARAALDGKLVQAKEQVNKIKKQMERAGYRNDQIFIDLVRHQVKDNESALSQVAFSSLRPGQQRSYLVLQQVTAELQDTIR